MAGNRYDVIIVGAGPAGSTLGYLLTSAGARVFLIDRALFPRPKTCGGAVTWRTRTLVESLTGAGFDERFTLTARTARYEIHERGRRRVARVSPEPFRFVDRAAYDREWLELAESRGCRVRLGDPVRELDPAAGRVRCGSGAVFQAGVVVGADGVHSLVRRTLFPGGAFRRGLAFAFQAEVPKERLREAYRSSAPKIVLGDVRWGYCWIFPRGDRRLVGMSGLIRKNSSFSTRFRFFLKRVTVDGLGTAAAGAAAPAGNFLGRPGSGRVLLAGDAAGFADPLTGEGLYFAHRSAREAARVILAAPAGGGGGGLVSRYRLGLEPVYLDLKAGLRLRSLAYSGGRRLGYLFARSPWFFDRLAEGIHGIRRFSNIPLLSR